VPLFFCWTLSRQPGIHSYPHLPWPTSSSQCGISSGEVCLLECAQASAERPGRMGIAKGRATAGATRALERPGIDGRVSTNARAETGSRVNNNCLAVASKRTAWSTFITARANWFPFGAGTMPASSLLRLHRESEEAYTRSSAAISCLTQIWARKAKPHGGGRYVRPEASRVLHQQQRGIQQRPCCTSGRFGRLPAWRQLGELRLGYNAWFDALAESVRTMPAS